MTTGDKIKAIRVAAKMTQKELGGACGIDAANIRKYEADRQNPKKETIIKIAAALGVNPADLDDSFVINLGSDVIHRNADGSFITVESGTPEAAALTVLDALNEHGQGEWIKRGEEMSKLKEYKK